VTSALGNALFEAIVTASGLASLFAPATVARACARAGVDIKAITRNDIRRVLPAIEQALRVYLPEGQVQTRLEAIKQLARAPLLESGPRPGEAAAARRRPGPTERRAARGPPRAAVRGRHRWPGAV
jgi:integrase